MKRREEVRGGEVRKVRGKAGGGGAVPDRPGECASDMAGAGRLE